MQVNSMDSDQTAAKVHEAVWSGSTMYAIETF